MEILKGNSGFLISNATSVRVHQTEPRVIERYRAGNMVPPLPDNLCMDFDSPHAIFRGWDHEMKSKELSQSWKVIFVSSPSRSGASRNGVDLSTPGLGMTSALIALGHSEPVRSRFSDGVLYMALGANASDMQVIDSLFEFMKFTGAANSATALRNEVDLTKAVKAAALW